MADGYSWVEDHQITFERLSDDWSHYVIHAQKYIGCIGTVIVYQSREITNNLNWRIEQQSRATDRAIEEAHLAWLERRMWKRRVA